MSRGVYGFPHGGIRLRVCEEVPAADGDGDLILIRAGDPVTTVGVSNNFSLPHGQVLLSYDASYGRWFSNPVLVAAQNGADWGLTTGGVYAEISNVSNMAPRLITLTNYTAFYKAGLRPQVDISGWINGSGAGGSYLFKAGIIYQDYDSGVGSPAVFTPDPTVQWTDSSARWKTSGWADFSGAGPTTTKHGLIQLQCKYTGGSAGAVRSLQMWFRWASAGGAVT